MSRLVATIVSVLLSSLASSSQAVTELTSCGFVELYDDVAIRVQTPKRSKFT
jgi:hypothetical protein